MMASPFRMNFLFMDKEFTDQKANAVEEARIAMSGRLLRCPLGDNPEDCPLYDIRKLPIEERVAWLQSKTDDEVVALFQQHVQCLKYKVSLDPRFGS